MSLVYRIYFSYLHTIYQYKSATKIVLLILSKWRIINIQSKLICHGIFLDHSNFRIPNLISLTTHLLDHSEGELSTLGGNNRSWGHLNVGTVHLRHINLLEIYQLLNITQYSSRYLKNVMGYFFSQTIKCHISKFDDSLWTRGHF